jgi:hypothetical protein
MQNTERQCLSCGSTLLGRIDKKFCDDACRSAFNNKSSSRSSAEVRKVNRILMKNRGLLEQLNPKGTARVKKEVLLQKGFDFNYLTNIYETKSGKMYYFCYDFGYMWIDDKELILVEKQEYVK